MEAGGEIFARAGELVRIDGSGFVPLTAAAACSELERFARFKALKGGKTGVKTVSAVLTEYKVKPLLAAPELHRQMPAIERLADYPMPVRLADGQVRLTYLGYDREARTWTVPDAPDLVVPATVEDAVEALLELVRDFCFAEAADGLPDDLYVASAMAYLLTPHVRFLFEPERAPIFLATANRPGCGKDLLLGLAMVLATGGQPAYSPPPGDTEETRKRLFAAARAGERFLLLSNAKGHLNNCVLEGNATSPHIRDRVLGVSEARTYPNTAIYGISGNGITLSEDLTRRCLQLQLVYMAEDLNAREYTYPDLYGHALANRAQYLGALQALVQNWCDKGCPGGSRPMASFTGWSAVAGGILEAADITNPISRGDLERNEDQAQAHFRKFLQVASTDHGSRSFVAKAARELITAHELFGYLGNMEERSAQCRFGRLLGSYEGRELGGLKLLRDTTTKTRRYRVETVG